VPFQLFERKNIRWRIAEASWNGISRNKSEQHELPRWARLEANDSGVDPVGVIRNALPSAAGGLVTELLDRMVVTSDRAEFGEC